MAKTVMVGVKQVPPKQAWKDLKEVVASNGNSKVKAALHLAKTDKEAEKAIIDYFEGFGESLGILGRITNCVAKEHPDVSAAFKRTAALASMFAHDYLALCGVPDDDESKERLCIWRLGDVEHNPHVYENAAWMIALLVENFIAQSFPVKSSKDLHEAMYNFFMHLAATEASTCMDEDNYNPDWLGVLENGKFIQKGENHEYIMEGIDCSKPLPGNGQEREFVKDLRDIDNDGE